MQYPTGARAAFYGSIGDPGRELTFAAHAFDEDALRRVVSCFIIANLPTEGVQEAFESLRGMLDFYSMRALLAPAEAPRVLQGTVVNSSNRPDLVLSSDE